MKVLVVPYDPAWVQEFEDEKDRITAALHPHSARIEHVGSTSVPGLGAKPTVDINIGLEDFSIADELVPIIEGLGYEYIPTEPEPDEGPGRRLFTRIVDGRRMNNVHMVQIHCPFWNQHIAFRDYLRSHPETRDAYFEMKMGLTEQDWETNNHYAIHKGPFIRRVLEKALKDGPPA